MSDALEEVARETLPEDMLLILATATA